MTAEAVDITIETSEKPMPVLSLTTGWKLSQSADGDRSRPRIRGQIAARVPGCVHTDLLAAGLIAEPFQGRNELDLQWIERADWAYALTFSVPAAHRAETLQELVFDGLDTVAEVRLNGTVILKSDNMYQQHRIAVGTLLKPTGNRLEVHFASPVRSIAETRADWSAPRSCNDPVGNCQRLRKQPSSFGWDWGPRFATSGFNGAVRLESRSLGRLAGVRVEQEHGGQQVLVRLFPDVVLPKAKGGQAGAGSLRASLRLGGTIVATATGVTAGGEPLTLTVDDPQLWWPTGQGAQPLYDLNLELLTADGVTADTIDRRLGLRTVVLDREADGFAVTSQGGQPLTRFGLRINDRLIFTKGANWVPVDAFIHGRGRAEYAPPLEAAVAANMNCVRLWGGGIYEHEAFYDLCDELGLIVWHDFMFACDLYPGDAAFLASVETEARQQVARLQHRACIGIWCGNNELVQINRQALNDSAAYRADYIALFHELLPRVLATHDGTRAYIPSSPDYHFEGRPGGHSPSHDEHDWQVWHSRAPVENYLTKNHRFCSEFGMQSYPSVPVAETFCPPEELNAFSPIFDNHQKNSGGNATIADYCARQYRFAASYRGLSFQSQANQAWCMQVAVEHFRRQQPQCLGAIYWQLNDVWPVASWSSLEYGNRWKVLHHVARRFFAPVLLTAVRHGEDVAKTGNYRHTTTGKVDLWLTTDAPAGTTGKLQWELLDLDGTVRARGTVAKQTLGHLESRALAQLDLTAQVERFGRERTYLRAWFTTAEGIVAETTVYFLSLRLMALKASTIKTKIKRIDALTYDVTLTADSHQHLAWLEFAGASSPFYSDNAVSLDAGRPRTICLTFARKPSATWAKQLGAWSIAHSWTAGALS